MERHRFMPLEIAARKAYPEQPREFAMDKHSISRLICILLGAAVLFGLERGLGVKFYIAIPVAIGVWLAATVAIGLALNLDKRAK
jgi:hypothetical protein